MLARAATDASIPLLALCFALAGIGIGCAETAEHATVASLAPEHVRGSGFGVLASVQSLSNLAASAIGGLLYTVASPARRVRLRRRAHGRRAARAGQQRRALTAPRG